MERLILRGVMYGADKIPDSFFEKIPGGYYKAKAQQHKKDDMTKKKRRSRSRRRYSDDEYEGGSRRGKEDGYRSEGHGRQDKSYDGAEDDHYDSINDRPRRPPSRAEHRGRGERQERATRHYDPCGSLDGGFSYGGSPVNPASVPPMSPDKADAVAAAAAATAAVAGRGPGSPSYPQPSPLETNYSPNPFSPQPFPPPGQQHPSQHNRSTSTLRGGMATGYVPYADIYGGPTGNPPPASDFGSVQPNYMNQVAPPVAQQPHQQNPFVQEAPLGSQPSYIPDPYYNPRQCDERYDQQARGKNGCDGYDSETERAPSRSRSRSRRRRRHDRSDSRGSYDSRDDRSRARSRHRNDSRVQQAPPRGKSGIRNQLQGKIDTSERGLGYSAVGALAGGLVGSEFGKGAVPSALGAVIGAIGANAFQARERYVDPRVPLSAQMSSPMPSHNSRRGERKADEMRHGRKKEHTTGDERDWASARNSRHGSSRPYY